TIASMIPVELNIMSRSAEAMGPLGSSTPSEQPPSAAAQINKMASATCCISGPLRSVGTARDAEQSIYGRHGRRRGTRGDHERPVTPAIPGAERCEKQKQVQDGKSEQPVCRPSIGFIASDQPHRDGDQRLPAGGARGAIDRPAKPQPPAKRRNRQPEK